MGRAAGQTQARATTTGGFEAVLGGRRGSAAAQAQRDITERESAIEEFEAAVEGAIGGRSVMVGGEMYIMNRAYRAQGEERAATLDHLVALAKKERWAVRELEVIAALDDPLGWPGFTEPAVYALGRYFEEGTFSDNSHARTVISTCLAGPYELARYERLRPLCDGIASFIARLPEGSGDGVCFAAWTALSNAPVEALTGPLASWVAVCEERLAKLPLGNPERGVLQAMRADQVQKFGAPVPAFLGLASRLGWRDAATGAGLRVLGEEAGTGR